MNDFLTKVYIEGKKNAIEEMAEERMKDIERTKIDTEKLTKQLLTIKGIGLVKAAEIVKIVTGGAGDD